MGETVRSDDPGGWRGRLERCAEAVDELRAAYEDELELRNQLILEAVDAGCSGLDVARWSRIGKARVSQIVAARALVLQEAGAPGSA